MPFRSEAGCTKNSFRSLVEGQGGLTLGATPIVETGDAIESERRLDA
jgi:hypothetical protein